ncbi:MAG: hypothetical protein OEZ02_14960, partial [Anaerolineae bacterium]|nr:hypothetical protein [Anaerolineae bacterium]
MKKYFLNTASLILFTALGCSGAPSNGASSSTQSAISTPTLQHTDDLVPETFGGPLTLQIWLSEEFDPSSGTPAAGLLQARLDQFAQSHPGLRITVRIKPLDGPSGILASLTAASAAAPLALPDLVLLTRTHQEAAVSANLLVPIKDLLTLPEDNDWYPFARQLSQVDNKFYGIPFAADVQILAYRPAVIGDHPTTWNAALQTPGLLVFPAADPQALSLLSLYQTFGGTLFDEAGNPSLDQSTLTALFTYFETAQNTGLIPFWVTQYDSDELAWQALRESRASLGLTWMTRLLGNTTTDIAGAPLPTRSGQSHHLATGWVWALPNPQVSRHAISIELAEFLTHSD